MSGGPHGPESAARKLGDGFDNDRPVADVIAMAYEFTRRPLTRADVEVLLDLWHGTEGLDVDRYLAVLNRFPVRGVGGVDPVALAERVQRYLLGAGMRATIGDQNAEAVMKAALELISALTMKLNGEQVS